MCPCTKHAPHLFFYSSVWRNISQPTESRVSALSTGHEHIVQYATIYLVCASFLHHSQKYSIEMVIQWCRWASAREHANYFLYTDLFSAHKSDNIPSMDRDTYCTLLFGSICFLFAGPLICIANTLNHRTTERRIWQHQRRRQCQSDGGGPAE